MQRGHTAPSRKPAAGDDDGWEVAMPAGAKKGRNRKKKQQSQAPTGTGATTSTPAPSGVVGGGKEAASGAAPSEAPATVSTVSQKIEVASPKLGVIIGQGGETLKKLQELTGTVINTPGKAATVSATATVVVEGPPEGVRACSQAVRDLATRGFSKLTHPGYAEGQVQMWPLYFPILIGKEGKGIRAIQDHFKIRIVMPDKSVIRPDKPTFVKLVGEKKDIEKAKADIKAMMRCYYSPATSPELTHQELDLEDQKLRDLIGPRGSTIKSIQGNTRCKIHTPQTNALNPKVVVVGLPANVDKALQHIERALNRAVEQREARYNDRFGDYDEEDYSDEE